MRLHLLHTGIMRLHLLHWGIMRLRLPRPLHTGIMRLHLPRPLHTGVMRLHLLHTGSMRLSLARCSASPMASLNVFWISGSRMRAWIVSSGGFIAENNMKMFWQVKMWLDYQWYQSVWAVISNRGLWPTTINCLEGYHYNFNPQSKKRVLGRLIFALCSFQR